MRLGSPPFSSAHRGRLSNSRRIVGAVTELSGSKTGAIIVIERRVALGEFVETGVRLDSNVSRRFSKLYFIPALRFTIWRYHQGDRLSPPAFSCRG